MVHRIVALRARLQQVSPLQRTHLVAPEALAEAEPLPRDPVWAQGGELI